MSDPAVQGLRDRRRADTVREIKQAALQLLAEGGVHAMSLRAVARQVGVSVQALYHYFDSRDALITDLVADAYHSLADAVAGAAQQRPPGRERVAAAGLAYRRWAIGHPAAFHLALGTPLPDYAAPQGGPTAEAAPRLGRAFREAIFGDWTPEQLGRIPLPGGTDLGERPLALPDASLGLPLGAFAVFTTGWSTLHGMVLLETLGHLPWVGDAGEKTCRAALLQYADRLEEHRAARR